MPKVKTAEAQKPIELKEPGPVVIYRAFEQLVRAEHALECLEKIGLYTGPNGEAMKAIRDRTITDLKVLKQMYHDLWASYLKAGEGL